MGEDDDGDFEVFVCTDRFKFNAAHFIAFKGFRERLHGHNYRVSVRLKGPMGPDGYVIDFGDIKAITRDICKELNEHFICPTKSDVLDISEADGQLVIVCEDGARFSFPRQDCCMLPIVHSSAEELARYLWGRIVQAFSVEKLRARGIEWMEVNVAEAPQQEARYKSRISQDSAVRPAGVSPSRPPAGGCGCRRTTSHGGEEIQ